jgi:hypothetical protein
VGWCAARTTPLVLSPVRSFTGDFLVVKYFSVEMGYL